MAEGLLRRLAPERFEVESAGTEAERLAVFRRVRDAIGARLTEWLTQAPR